MTGSGLTAGWRARMRPRCPAPGRHVGRQGAGGRQGMAFRAFGLAVLLPFIPRALGHRGAWGGGQLSPSGRQRGDSS